MIVQEHDNMMTVGEVCELLHVHPNTLRRWSDEGKIAAYIIGTRGDRRFRKSDIANFLDKFRAYKY